MPSKEKLQLEPLELEEVGSTLELEPLEQVDVTLDYNPPEEKTLAGYGGNLLSSGAKFVGDIGKAVVAAPGLLYEAVARPAALGTAAIEASKGIPDYLAERYGGPQQILDTLYKDPVGFAADLSTVFSGAGALAKAGKLGKVAEGLSKAAAVTDPVALAVGAVKKPAEFLARKGLTPTLKAGEKGAVAFAGREGIPLTADVRTGSPVLSGVKALVKHVPGSAGRLAQADERTVQALQEAGFRIADRLTPENVSKISVGEGLAGDVSSEAKRYGKKASSRYERLYGTAGQNVVEVQIGEKISQIVDEFGRDITTPIMKDIETPVDLAAIKEKLRPLYNEIAETLPISQQEASPGFRALKQVMDGPDMVSLKTANQNLSTIKGIGRADIPELVTKSERIAKVTTGPLNQAVNEAASGLGRKAESDLLQGKYFTKKKYDLDYTPPSEKGMPMPRRGTEYNPNYKPPVEGPPMPRQPIVMKTQEMLAAAEKEPVLFVKSLIRNDDASVHALKIMNANFPKKIPQLAKATLTDILENATERGGFGGQKAFSEWLNLGPQTRTILFPNTRMRHDLGKFFQLASMVAKDVNPSGTAKVASLGGLGAAAYADPIAGATYLASSRLLTELLIAPGGVEKVVQALQQARALKPSKLTKLSTATRVTEEDTQ